MHTILILMIIHGAILLLALGWLVFAAYRAPEGWEDARGFHFGRREVPAALKTSAQMYQSERTQEAPRLIKLALREEE